MQHFDHKIVTERFIHTTYDDIHAQYIFTCLAQVNNLIREDNDFPDSQPDVRV